MSKVNCETLIVEAELVAGCLVRTIRSVGIIGVYSYSGDIYVVRISDGQLFKYATADDLRKEWETLLVGAVVTVVQELT